MILLVVDTQKGCFDERLYAFETVRNNIKQLITILMTIPTLIRKPPISIIMSLCGERVMQG